MNRLKIGAEQLRVNIMTLIILIAFAILAKRLGLQEVWQNPGLMTFSIGLALLAAYTFASILKKAKFPMISGYIFSGIIAGPYITGFLDAEMVREFRLVDDLALSFIAMTAGGAMHLKILAQRRKALFLNIVLITLIVFFLVFLFVLLAGRHFSTIGNLSRNHLLALSVLLGIVAIARSPSSAIAIISECRAKGPFTETVLGVVVVMDVLIIVLFSIALSVTHMMLTGTTYILEFSNFVVMFFTIGASLITGGIIGRLIAGYIEGIGHDLTLFLLFIAFGITKSCMAFNIFMEAQFQIHLSLEPLLVCMSVGFVVQNFSGAGDQYLSTLEDISLPIYVFFFFVSGASLNIDALRICWPLAFGLVVLRIVGIFGATWLAATLNQDPPSYRHYAWMAYLTQAGVALGLSQIAQRQFPEIGTLLATVVLAVITLNQIIGPIAFKSALILVGEARKA